MLNIVSATPPAEGFKRLNLIDPICRAVHEEGYTEPTPIQKKAIPHLLEGRDLLGCAQTGTGKTAAFSLPILQRLAATRKQAGPRGARALILAPTRELAVQIDESLRVYGRHLKLTRAMAFGGVNPNPQIRALSRGVDILVATPGRLLDYLRQGCVSLNQVELFVLDEADRMLDMGFVPDIRKIYAKVPAQRQSMLFSATFPDEVLELTRQFLNDPVSVSVAPPARPIEKIDQRILFVDRENKCALLETMLQDADVVRALVFTRTKHGANRVANNLKKNRIRAGILHGNKSQSARLQALEQFRSGHARVLVATDIAARGLDIDGITHVINYDLPMEAESYVHRIGRTARAGAVGIAVSFCDAKERGFLWRIEKGINGNVRVDANHPFHSPKVEALGAPGKGRSRRNNGTEKSGNSRTQPRHSGQGPNPGGKPGFSRGKPKRRFRGAPGRGRGGR